MITPHLLKTVLQTKQPRLARYDCGPVRLSGDSNAVYERHITFDQVVAGTETSARSDVRREHGRLRRADNGICDRVSIDNAPDVPVRAGVGAGSISMNGNDQIAEGQPLPPGVTWEGDGWNFSLYSRHATGVTLLCDASDLYVMISAFWEPMRFQIQQPGPWNCVVDTSRQDLEKQPVDGRSYEVAPNSVVVLERAC